MATITEEPEEQLDSGIMSDDVRSPEIKSILPDEDDDIEDETILERLAGLTEMFPEGVRNFTYNTSVYLEKCAKGFYSFSCSSTWFIFSSSAVLFAPLIFEIERAHINETQLQHQKQLLYGPNSTMAGPGGLAMPPVQR